MVDMYLDLVKKFPSILILIDPLRKEVSSFYLYTDIFKFALLFLKQHLKMKQTCR